jgi:group I intron endonuclease
MELSKRQQLSNKILDNPDLRYCEIYKLTNLTNHKCYIGQAVSHILNHKRYRPYGSGGRFRCHISEAFSTKKNQSHYLNNAIRKYGVDEFELEVLECCELADSDERETHYIISNNTTFPNGYNLKLGGKQFAHTQESKRRVSQGIHNYYIQQKFERFKDVSKIGDDIEKYIKPLKRDNLQYGWYVYIDRKKADFGGVHISIDDSKQMAIDFINKLKEEQMATYLDAGNSLEPTTTTS